MSERINGPRGDTAEQERPVPCRTCGAPVPADSPHAPFCRERCRMADLAAWFGGRYRISRPLNERDLEQDD